ncbi:hypothetical protein QJS66_16665 [Kocuria rhizophila]|nr:hypothetical protein QJS66_16665 [Kocuria rhizophila]
MGVDTGKGPWGVAWRTSSQECWPPGVGSGVRAPVLEGELRRWRLNPQPGGAWGRPAECRVLHRHRRGRPWRRASLHRRASTAAPGPGGGRGAWALRRPPGAGARREPDLTSHEVPVQPGVQVHPEVAPRGRGDRGPGRAGPDRVPGVCVQRVVRRAPGAAGRSAAATTSAGRTRRAPAASRREERRAAGHATRWRPVRRRNSPAVAANLGIGIPTLSGQRPAPGGRRQWSERVLRAWASSSAEEPTLQLGTR